MIYLTGLGISATGEIAKYAVMHFTTHKTIKVRSTPPKRVVVWHANATTTATLGLASEPTEFPTPREAEFQFGCGKSEFAPPSQS